MAGHQQFDGDCENCCERLGEATQRLAQHFGADIVVIAIPRRSGQVTASLATNVDDDVLPGVLRQCLDDVEGIAVPRDSKAMN